MLSSPNYLYVRVTKERQWKRPTMPVPPAITVENEAAPVSTTISSDGSSKTSITDAKSALPPTKPKPSRNSTESAVSSSTLAAAATKPIGEKPVPPPRPGNLRKTKENATEPSALPTGWREAVDKKSNRVYYVNE